MKFLKNIQFFITIEIMISIQAESLCATIYKHNWINEYFGLISQRHHFKSLFTLRGNQTEPNPPSTDPRIHVNQMAVSTLSHDFSTECLC